jgi:hypothetical protein
MGQGPPVQPDLIRGMLLRGPCLTLYTWFKRELPVWFLGKTVVFGLEFVESSSLLSLLPMEASVSGPFLSISSLSCPIAGVPFWKGVTSPCAGNTEAVFGMYSTTTSGSCVFSHDNVDKTHRDALLSIACCCSPRLYSA